MHILALKCLADDGLANMIAHDRYPWGGHLYYNLYIIRVHRVPKSTLSEDFSLVWNDTLYEDIGMISYPKQVFSVIFYFGIIQFLRDASLLNSKNWKWSRKLKYHTMLFKLASGMPVQIIKKQEMSERRERSDRSIARHGRGSRGPLKGPGGVQGQRPLNSVLKLKTGIWFLA